MAIRSPKHGLTRVPRGWVKKINRRTRWVCSHKAAPTPQAADAEYERLMTGLWAGTPTSVAATPGAATCKAVANLFCDRKERAGVAGRTLTDYEDAIADFLRAVGNDADPLALTPRDFARCRAAWAKRFGPDRLAKFILAVRGMFKWARRPPLRLPEPDYGDEFDPPAKLAFRRRRNADRAAHGPRLFTTAEVKALLAKANRNMRAMILLALNGGFGNTDLAELPRAAIDLDGGWIDYARGKTGVQRRVPLWPETVKAVRDVLDYRPKSRKRPKAPPPALLFITRQGRAYVEDRRSAKGRPLHKDRISTQFNLLCATAEVARFRRGFYSLRRTHRSLTDEAGDQRAAALLMGHELPDIGGVYVQRISDERLKALTGHVRTSLKIAAAIRIGREPREKPRAAATGGLAVRPRASVPASRR